METFFSLNVWDATNLRVTSLNLLDHFTKICNEMDIYFIHQILIMCLRWGKHCYRYWRFHSEDMYYQSLSHVQLYVTPWTDSLPGSSVLEIFQAKILEGLPFPILRDLPGPGTKPTSRALAGIFFSMSLLWSMKRQNPNYNMT